jgi:hypothetical protein
MPRNSTNIVLLPVAPFLLEFHSERMVDLMLAVREAGFRVEHVANTKNRFRIEDDNHAVDSNASPRA